MSGSTAGGSGEGTAGWALAYRDLCGRPLEDLSEPEIERLAVASYLIGDDARCTAMWEEAHRRHAEGGDPAGAALCAFWSAFSLMMRGQMAQAGAWLGRAEATLASTERCRASGYVLVPALIGALDAGELETARELAAQAGAVAESFADPDLAAFARLGDGQALMAMGDVPAATAQLDAVMLSVSTGEVGPVVAGIVYCAVILECMQVFDLARASEWTEALYGWCEGQPELVPYRGQCLVHRSQLQQAAGDWASAYATAVAACDRLAEPPHPALGLARYQEAELHRLRGSYDEAAAAYGQAGAHGHDPMPGLALLELARGDVEGAAAGIRRALDSTTITAQRPALLAAAVDILREARDIAGARRAADELRAIADASPSEVLRAMAEQATGAALLGEGETAGALAHLRVAHQAWTGLQMPLETARTSVLLGLGCLSLGDHASAGMEFDNARVVFADLGAGPDADRLSALQPTIDIPSAPATDSDSDLSAREVEVLTHVAAGRTNREIAAVLTISQHTVGRHLENLFAKLGVNSRAAATAYAYEHGLL
jgi:DNA-binding CsgD family transcriptional regulator/tetratricopeptide (TPR) repeat protein